MAKGPDQLPLSAADWWTASGWSSVVVAGAALMAWVTLPNTSPAPFTTWARGDIFRPSWLVLGLLLAYPVYLAARASWAWAPLLVVLLVGQTWYVVSTGLDALTMAGLKGSVDDLWYLLVLAQLVVGGAAAIAGGRQCWRRRRWNREMQVMFPDLARRGVVEELAPPAWREGFYFHG